MSRSSLPDNRTIARSLAVSALVPAFAALAGLLVVGAIYAFNSWPLRYSELEMTSWHSKGGEIVYTMINGVPTGEAWNGYYAGCVGFSLAGAIAGGMFWYSISRPGRPNVPRNDDWKYTP